jgi:hypothetical protein
VYQIVNVEVLDLQTDDIVLTDIIIGSEPDECPEKASSGQKIVQILGEPPTQEEVTEKLELWLELVLNKE